MEVSFEWKSTDLELGKILLPTNTVQKHGKFYLLLMDSRERNCLPSERAQSCNVSSRNLRKTSGTNCPGTERPLSLLQQSALCSSTWLKHLFCNSIYSFIQAQLSVRVAPSLSIFKFSLSLFLPFTFCHCHCLFLDSEAYVPSAKQAVHSKSLSDPDWERKEEDRVGESEGDGE